jgi:hypothetical protein
VKTDVYYRTLKKKNKCFNKKTIQYKQRTTWWGGMQTLQAREAGLFLMNLHIKF